MPTAELHKIPKRKTDRRRDKGIGADGVDAQNTRLEVQHNVFFGNGKSKDYITVIYYSSSL